MSEEFKPVRKGKKFIVLFLLLVVTPGGLFFFRSGKHSYCILPYLGEKEVMGPGDTLYYTVPGFSFTDQNGRTVTDATYAGKILVVDFFCTRCTTICPRMTTQMQQLQFQLDDPAYGDVAFLSHTVDPEHDTPEVLRTFARQHEVDTTRWHFLTGDAKAIYRQGNLGYLLTALEDSTDPEGFVHSERFLLVDDRRHIRGQYDGTNTAERGRLVMDVKTLVAEKRKRDREAGKR